MTNLTPREQEIKERLTKATPGPIEVIRFDNEGGEITYQVETKIEKHRHVILSWYTDLDNPKAKADAELAAYAPTDLKYCLETIQKLREQDELLLNEVECLRSVLSEWDEDKSCYIQWMRANDFAKQRQALED